MVQFQTGAPVMAGYKTADCSLAGKSAHPPPLQPREGWLSISGPVNRYESVRCKRRQQPVERAMRVATVHGEPLEPYLH